MKNMLFVMNPMAGLRKANKLLPEILGIFNRAGYRVMVHITESQGDAARVVAQEGANMDVLVCCGGDGTFNETLAGMLGAGLDLPIGYIPAGSTNDLANSLHLPSNILEAAKNIVEGEPVAYDVGQFNGRYFSYVASFGAFTRASYATPQNMKNALGHTAYVLGGIGELTQIRDIPVHLELDGETLEGNYIFGAVCNSTSVAGLLTLDSKQVDMQDGKFEVLLVRGPKDLVEITELLQAIQNKTYNCRMMTFRSAGNVRITMENPVDWTLDGERQEGQNQVEIQCCPLAVRLLKRREDK